MGRDESRFNVLFIAKDKVARQCPQTTTFEEKGEPKQIRTEVPLLTSLTVGPKRLHRTVTNKVSKHLSTEARWPIRDGDRGRELEFELENFILQGL